MKLNLLTASKLIRQEKIPHEEICTFVSDVRYIWDKSRCMENQIIDLRKELQAREIEIDMLKALLLEEERKNACSN